MNTDRLAVVRQCVLELWETRADGRWSAMEDAMTKILNGPQPAGTPPRRLASVLADGSPYPPNVIVLKDRLRARAARRRGER